MALQGPQHRLVGRPVGLLDDPLEVSDRLMVMEDQGEADASDHGTREAAGAGIARARIAGAGAPGPGATTRTRPVSSLRPPAGAPVPRHRAVAIDDRSRRAGRAARRTARA